MYEQKYLAEVKMKQNEKLLWNCYFADFETQNVLLQGNAEKHNRVMRNYKILGMLEVNKQKFIVNIWKLYL